MTALLLYTGIANPYAGYAGEWVGPPAVDQQLPAEAGLDWPDRPSQNADLPSRLGRKLESAFSLAVHRLRTHSECRQLFHSLDRSAEDSLRAGRFDAAPGRLELRVCGGEIAAFTHVGGEVTYLCRAFARLAPARAAGVVIHEALHQAGLPESPAYPGALGSREIDALVSKHCRL